MKLLLVLGLLAASVMNAAADHCLADCNSGMTQCLATCPTQCPVDPTCMKTCFNQCTLQEKDCAAKCIVPSPPSQVAALFKAGGNFASLAEEQYQTHFSQFVRKYNKQYPADEFFGQRTQMRRRTCLSLNRSRTLRLMGC
jgi:hypothetical protein